MVGSNKNLDKEDKKNIGSSIASDIRGNAFTEERMPRSISNPTIGKEEGENKKK